MSSVRVCERIFSFVFSADAFSVNETSFLLYFPKFFHLHLQIAKLAVPISYSYERRNDMMPRIRMIILTPYEDDDDDRIIIIILLTTRMYIILFLIINKNKKKMKTKLNKIDIDFYQLNS